jgi:hypothetical protein
MAISSLSKLTVPAPGAANNSQGMLMPKLKYRFRVVLSNFGANGQPATELTKQVMNMTRPAVTFEEIKLPVYNSTIKMAGKHSWTDVKLTLRDDIGGNVTSLVGQQLQKQFDFFEQASAPAAIDYKFQTYVQILDGGNGAFEPQILETWELLGCYVKTATYSNVDYNSGTDPVDVALDITYDNALQVDTNGLVGPGVGGPGYGLGFKGNAATG